MFTIGVYYGGEEGQDPCILWVMQSPAPVLTPQTINKRVLAAEYAVRGELAIKATDLATVL
jgi:hypothetical protein